MSRIETIAEGVTLYLGDCREILPTLSEVDHVISDPPYEARMQALHAEFRLRRTDGGPQRQALTFESIQDMRDPFLDEVRRLNKGWLLAFCNVEGVGEWQTAILARGLKFKTTCIWNKPDATPKLNGQGPALSLEGNPMLYDPKWERKTETKADPFVLANLIGWLHEQPPEKSYQYDCNGQCLLATYLTDHGFKKVSVMPESFRHEGAGHSPLPAYFDAIAIGGVDVFGYREILREDCCTYGRALIRARMAALLA